MYMLSLFLDTQIYTYEMSLEPFYVASSYVGVSMAHAHTQTVMTFYFMIKTLVINDIAIY